MSDSFHAIKISETEVMWAPVIETLSDEQLEELNTILPWRAFLVDSKGRRFGRPASEAKRNAPSPIPDRRIVEFNRRIPLQDLVVLEVGCFEGLHTVPLAKLAREVKACDSRIVNIAKSAVRCAMFQVAPKLFVWDVEKEVPSGQHIDCDVVHHVGVLYHLFDPVAHLRSLLPHVRRGILLDTHYSADTAATEKYSSGGKEYCFWPYREGGYADPFSGVYASSRWLLLSDIIGLLEACGFSKVEVMDDRQERNGLRATILAERR